MNEIEKWLYTFYDEVEPIEFYRDLWPEGTLDEKGKMTKGKYTGILLEITDEKKKSKNGRDVPVIKRRTITDDLDAIREVIECNHFCITSPISYAGKSRAAENGRYAHGIAVDLDKIKKDKEGKPVGIETLMHQVKSGFLPCPTYIVSSGTGAHLYYIFETPIPLYDQNVEELQKYKHRLTDIIWNQYVVDLADRKEVQFEGIFQGFRMPGTVTKAKDGSRARAFLTGERVTMEYMNDFQWIRQEDRANLVIVQEQKEKKKQAGLKAAAEQWPEWYERRVVNKEAPKYWRNNRALYEWWKGQIYNGATVGHRYFCIMCLAIYAQKCSIYDEKKNPNPVTREELEEDAFELQYFLDAIPAGENNRFTESDILQALELFNESWTKYPREIISYRSGIPIKENKRNKQKQRDHLEEARALRDIRMRRQGKKWTDGNGRPKGSGTKENAIKEYLHEHPAATPSEVARELKISRTTVYKFWNA